jgi:hypothetical protein
MHVFGLMFIMNETKHPPTGIIANALVCYLLLDAA